MKVRKNNYDLLPSNASPSRRGDWPFPLVAVITVVLAFCYIRPYILPGIGQPSKDRVPSWAGALPGTPEAQSGAPLCDPDTYLIHGGLIAAPRFRDTLRWWTGTWAGQVPFYRPLASWLFWSEWKLFGDNEARYQAVGICLYLLALWQFLCVTHALYERYRVPFPGWATLLTGMLFVNGLGLLTFQQVINAEVFSPWKNQPDTLCALFTCAMMRHYLKAMPADAAARSNDPDDPNDLDNLDNGKVLRPAPLTGKTLSLPRVLGLLAKWLPTYAALGYYLLGCASKEAAVLLVLLLPLLEAPHLQSGNRMERRQAMRRLLPLLIALPLFLLWRALCLHAAVGFQYGSNRAWPARFAANAFGAISEAVMARAWYELILGAVLCVTALILARRGKALGGMPRLSVAEGIAWIVSMLVCLVVLGLLVSWKDEAVGHDPVVVLMRFALPTYAWGGVKIFVFVVGAYSLVTTRFHLALFAYGWALLILFPTLFSPSVLHRYYLMNMGYALLLGTGLTCRLSKIIQANSQGRL